MRAAMRAFYDDGPLGSVSWPDPFRPEGPPEEAYSRVTDPDRYRIVGARVDAWRHAVVTLGLAEEERSASAPTGWSSAPGSTGVLWLRPRRPAAQPLLLDVGAVEVAGDHVRIGVGDPALVVGARPQCGCDACDDGSENLLDEIDRVFEAVIAGDFVHAEDEHWSVTTGPDGCWSASGVVGGEQAPRIIAAVRSGATVGRRSLLGGPW